MKQYHWFLHLTKLSMLFIGMLFHTSLLAQSLTIAVAANFQYAIEDIDRAFEQEYRVTVQTIVGSSGKLSAQIMNGAPYHIFLSADLKYPTALFEKDLTTERPAVYARGALVAWSMEPINSSDSLNIFKQSRIKKIAVANPDLAPYGKEALKALSQLDFFTELQKKIIYGQSIAQVNHYIQTHVVDIGITSKSSVMAASLKEKGYWFEISPLLYEPISQGIVIISATPPEMMEKARLFYNFMFSENVGGIIMANGYLVP